MPAGRPTKYEPHFCKQAEKLCKLGATDKELADFFEVSEQTINAWKDQFPEFLESLKAGKDMADANVAQRLYERAMGFEHPEIKHFVVKVDQNLEEIQEREVVKIYPPDTTAAIFWLKNRQPQKWRDRVEQDISVTENQVIKPAAPQKSE